MEAVPEYTQDAVLVYRSESSNTVRGYKDLEGKALPIATRHGAFNNEDETNERKDTNRPLFNIKFRGLVSRLRLDVASKVNEEEVDPKITQTGEAKPEVQEALVIDKQDNASEQPKFSLHLAEHSDIDIEKAELIATFTGLTLVIFMISCCISCMSRKNKEEDSEEKLIVNFDQKFTKIQFTDAPAVLYNDETEHSSY